METHCYLMLFAQYMCTDNIVPFKVNCVWAWGAISFAFVMLKT
jgi:hypothetical protein